MSRFRVLLPPSSGASRVQARADLLRDALRDHLDREIEIWIAESYADLETAALEESAQLMWAPPHVVARLARSARSIFVAVRHGQVEYQAGIAALREARVSLRDLDRLRAAWVDELSMGGHVLAKAYLRDRGLDPATLKEERFHGSYPAALEALIRGEADIASVTVHRDERSDLVIDLGLYAEYGAPQIEILAITEACPNDALLLNRAVEPEVAERLERDVLAAAGSRAGSALALAVGCDGFERAPAERYLELRAWLEEHSTTEG